MEQVMVSYQVLSRCSLEDGSNRDGKMRAARTLAELLPTIVHLSEFEKVLGLCIAALLRLHADSDMAVWPAAEESLFSLLRALVAEERLGERVMVDLFKAVRRGVEKEKMRRVALERFTDFCGYLPPSRCRRFAVAFLPVVIDIVEEGSEPLLETLAACFPRLLAVLAFYLKEKEVRQVVSSCTRYLLRSSSSSSASSSLSSSANRRSCAELCAAVCAVYPRPQWEFCLVEARPLLEAEEAGAVQAGLVMLTALAREAAIPAEDWRNHHNRDPRAPLAAFGAQMIGAAEAGLARPKAPLVWQAAAELAARLPAALPWCVNLWRERTASLRGALERLAGDSLAGPSRRASALQALAAFGGAESGSSLVWDELLIPAEDPLVRGAALLALARGGLAGARALLAGARDESPVVARLALEAAGEVLGREETREREREELARGMTEGGPREYWVVERQRLASLGAVGPKWSLVSANLRRRALATLLGGLEQADPRVRSAAAAGLAESAPYLGGEQQFSPMVGGKGIDNSGGGETAVLEGAWRGVPAVAHRLLAAIRLHSCGSLASLLGHHEALFSLSRRWCSPRAYLKRESARAAAARQRPLHASWPNPLAPIFGVYAARAVAEMLARPAQLLAALDHHQRVLLCCASLARGGGASYSPPNSSSSSYSSFSSSWPFSSPPLSSRRSSLRPLRPPPRHWRRRRHSLWRRSSLSLSPGSSLRRPLLLAPLRDGLLFRPAQGLAQAARRHCPRRGPSRRRVCPFGAGGLSARSSLGSLGRSGIVQSNRPSLFSTRHISCSLRVIIIFLLLSPLGSSLPLLLLLLLLLLLCSFFSLFYSRSLFFQKTLFRSLCPSRPRLRLWPGSSGAHLRGFSRPSQVFLSSCRGGSSRSSSPALSLGAPRLARHGALFSSLLLQGPGSHPRPGGHSGAMRSRLSPTRPQSVARRRHSPANSGQTLLSSRPSSHHALHVHPARSALLRIVRFVVIIIFFFFL